MSKIFEEVREIPKIEKVGVRISKYDEMLKAITETPIGTKGKITISRSDVQNVYSALNTRIAKQKIKALQLFIRNAKREKVTSEKGKEYLKLVEGDLYFLREEKK